MAKKSPTFSGNPALVSLGQVVRAKRKAKWLSQEALADKAGIDRSYMCGIVVQTQGRNNCKALRRMPPSGYSVTLS